MKPKHTPGPWGFENHGSIEIWNQNTKIAIINGAHEFESEQYGPENLANARIIAAAPEMLEALECFLDVFGTTKYKDTYNTPLGDALDFALSVLAKARGGS